MDGAKKLLFGGEMQKKLISPLNKRYFHILSLSLECLK